MGIVCPEGQEVGDRKSGDQMGSRPNALKPKVGSKNGRPVNEKGCPKGGAHDPTVPPSSAGTVFTK